MYTNALDTNLLIESYSSNGLCLEGYYGGKPSTIAGLYAKGCTIIDRGNKKIWQNVGDCDNVVWFDVTSGGVSSINGITDAVTLSAGNNISLNQVGNDIQFNANFTQTGKYMISGGAIWSGTGLTYNVSIISYFFNGFKTGSQTNVTLDPSDPLENRLDAIVVDEAGVVSVITGDPSASPVTPPIPEDQLLVQYIIVIAGSTEPVVVQDAIYLDDPTSNWTFSTYNTATPATGTINFAGTNSPKQGINDIEASTDLRKGARFVRSTSFDAYQYTMFSVWVRFTGTAVATNKALNVRFENSAGTLVGNTVNLFSYGLSRSILNTWQLVVIPITAFGNLPATVKGLKVIMAGGTVGAVRQWDIDYMILTNGSIPSANVPTIAFYRNGTGIASQTGLNIIQGTGMTITAANDPTNGRVNYTFNAAGGSPAGSDTQIQYNNAGAFGADSGFTRDVATGNTNISATYSGNLFKQQINSNIESLGYEGSAMTFSDGSGNTGIRGLYIETGKGDYYILDNLTLSDGTIVENKIDIGSTASVTYTYNGTSFLSGTSVIASDYINIYNDVGAGNELGFFVESGTLLLGNRTGGNNTKITIDDVNYLFGYSSGIIRGNAFHNNGNVAQGNSTQQDVRSGTYTPTLTNVTNITSSTADKFQWMRVGNVVTVSGRVNIENTATGASELGISLPIASDIGATTDCVGSAPGSTSGILDDVGWVIGDATNNRAAMQSTAIGTGAHDHWVSFTYEVK